MEKPYKFHAVHSITKEVRYFNNIMFKPYVFLGETDQWTIYEDTRYAGKIRLYNYINGIKPVRYNPYAGTEIGKSMPILNF